MGTEAPTDKPAVAEAPRSDAPRAEAPRTVKPVAVIDVGTSSIRMAIAEISDAGGVRTLENLSQAVSLGKDSFTLGHIANATIEDCVRVLRSYRRKLSEYQIDDPRQIRVVATSAVREARNRLAFLDRIYIATGLDIEAIDEAEVNRVTFLSVQPQLRADATLAGALVVVLEVGGGSSEMLLIKEGNVLYAHTYRLGALRLRQTLETYRAPSVKMRGIMETHVARTVEEIRQHAPREGRIEVVAMGGDVRFAVAQLLKEWTPDTLVRLPLPDLVRFTDRMLRLSEDELVQKYHIHVTDAETVGPALLTYVQLARAFQLDHVLVTDANLRDGLLTEMAAKAAWTEEFSQQIVRSALDLGRKFTIDEPHALHVAELSRNLFRELADEHHLPARYEIILYVAALLHEIGLFVSNRSYHKHSMYLIRNSELFGLSKTDLLLVALVARYHRRASPLPSHEGYATLDREQRVAVAKMAAMLRVAVALDESRSQRIKQLRCEADDGRMVIVVPGVEDLSLEQVALNQNVSLFEETYGLPVLLRRGRK
jgi:exopolyphosphatase/guanosine-5'-triphosphate,3'-diphosphate pyrophosphatase